MVVLRRYWLLHCDAATDPCLIANQLFRRLLDIPFVAKFVVFARALSSSETRLRIFCVTDDKLDKTLERHQNYTAVAHSQQVEVSLSSRSLIRRRSHSALALSFVVGLTQLLLSRSS